MRVDRDIADLIAARLAGFPASGKTGRRLEREVAVLLAAVGLEVDRQDSRRFLAPRQPAWRDKESGEVEEPTGRLRLDLVVRSGGHVVALVEVESDLNDLRETGVTRRPGRYDVFSIARSASGRWFHSYKSVERMAAAAYYAAGGTRSGLEGLRSDRPSEHNPEGLGLLLVAGTSRGIDRDILRPRLDSLGARLISIVERA